VSSSISGRKALIALAPIVIALLIIQWSIGDGSNGPSEAMNVPSEAIVSDSEQSPGLQEPLEERAGERAQQPPSTRGASPAPEPDSSPGGDPDSDDSWEDGPQTMRAMDQPNMQRLTADDPRYSGTTEARQLFHAFEMDLLAAAPLNPTNYRALLGRHKSDNAAALKRVMDLRTEGREKAATDLYDEWSRLFELYRKRAYSRAPSK